MNDQAGYEIVIVKPVQKELRKLAKKSPQELRRIVAAIDGLKLQPRPHGVEKLSGTEKLYRIRVGDFRIIYQIQDQKLLVILARVGNRREIYEADSVLEAVKRVARHIEGDYRE